MKRKLKDFIVDPKGQWNHPGKKTFIPAANGSITMRGVKYPVLGIDDQGNQQMMYPDQEYQFPGNGVYEIPMAQTGLQTKQEKPLIYSRENYVKDIEANANNIFKNGVYETPYKTTTRPDEKNCINGICYITRKLTNNALNIDYISNSNFKDDLNKNNFYTTSLEDGFEIGDILQYYTHKGSLMSGFPGEVNPANSNDPWPQHAVSIIGKRKDNNGQTFLKIVNNRGTDIAKVEEISELDLIKRAQEGYKHYDGILVNRYDPEKVQEINRIKKENADIFSGKNNYAQEYNKSSYVGAFKNKDIYGKTLEEPLSSIEFRKTINELYPTLGKSSNMPKEEFDILMNLLYGIGQQESDWGSSSKKAVKDVIPESIYPTLRKLTDSNDDDWRQDYWNNNANNVKTKYKNIEEFKKSISDKNTDPEVTQYLRINSPKSKGIFQQKELSERGRYFNYGFDDTKSQIASAAALLVDNYHKVKKKFPDKPEGELIQLAVLMHNAPSKALNPTYADYYAKNNNIDYFNKVEAYSAQPQLAKPYRPLVKSQQISKSEKEKILNFLDKLKKTGGTVYSNGGTFDPDTDEFIGFSDELPQAQRGSQVRKPIYITDPNDRRIQMYNDSLTLSKTEDFLPVSLSDPILYKTVDDKVKSGTIYGSNIFDNPKNRKAAQRLSNTNDEYNSVKPIWNKGKRNNYRGVLEDVYIQNFAKPVQPYEYRRPVVNLEELKSLDTKSIPIEETPVELSKRDTGEPFKPSRVVLREMGNISRYNNNEEGVIKEPYNNSHEVYMDDKKGWRKVSPDEYQLLIKQYPGSNQPSGWTKPIKKAQVGKQFNLNADPNEKKVKREIPKRDEETDTFTRELKQGLGLLGQLGEDASNVIGDFVAPLVPKNKLASQFYFNNYAPIEYPDAIKASVPILRTAWNLFNPTGNISKDYLASTAANFSKPNRPIGLDAEKDYDVGEEAWRQALGLPYKGKYIFKSMYKPSNAKNPDTQYYSISDDIMDKQKIIDYIRSEDFNKRSREGSMPYSRVADMGTFSEFIKDDFMDTENFKQIDPLQQFQISKAWDPEQKQWYASIYDKYDFNFKPANAGITPYEYYDRIYYYSPEKPTYGPQSETSKVIQNWKNPTVVEKNKNVPQSKASKVTQAYGNPFLNKKQTGGTTNTLEGDLISKVIMNRNRDKDFVRRAYAVGEYPESNMFVQPDANEFGDKNSHLMSWGEDESGQAYMYPEVMNPNNEAIKIPNQYADYISSIGYKKASGIPYAEGGTFNPDTDEFIGYSDELDRYQKGKQVKKNWDLPEGFGGYQKMEPSTTRVAPVVNHVKEAQYRAQAAKDVANPNINDDDFRDKHGYNKHVYQMNNDPQYRAEVEANAKELAKRNGSIDLPSTYMDSKSFTGNPNLNYMIPNGLTGEARKAYEESQMNVVGAVLPIPGLQQMGRIPSIGTGINAARKALGTETGLLSNAYKYNPWAFKPNSGSAYRMIGGKEGYLDAINSGEIRAMQNGIYGDAHFNMGLPLNPNRLSSEELLKAGSPGGYKGPYMVERKWADNAWNKYTMADAFKDNPEIFQALKDLGKDKDVWGKYGNLKTDDIAVKLYKEHWLHGYKEVPKQLPGLKKTDYMSLLAPKGNMYGQNQVLVQQSRLLNPEIKAKFFQNQAPEINATINRNLLGDRIMKVPKDFNNRITPENYEEFVNRIHGSTGYDLSANSWKKPTNLGIGNYDKSGIVYSDAPLNNLGKDIINAHEKNHGMFAGTLSTEMSNDLLKPFGTKRAIPNYADKHQADEVLARMGQFKNAVGIGNNQTFTLGHLNLIRKNYANSFIDNGITEMLKKIKPGSKGEQQFLKNMNKYAFGSTPFIIGAGALQNKKQGGSFNPNTDEFLGFVD